MSGIYMIINKVNGNLYIGQSVDIERRWAEHKSQSRRKSTVLGRAFLKYGIEAFAFEVLEMCSEEELNDKEMSYIDQYRPKYNMNEGGKGNKGHRLNESIKARLSEHGKRQWSSKSDEEKILFTKNNLCGPKERKPVPEEQKQRQREKMLGRQTSDYQKQRASEVNKILLIGNCRRKRAVIQCDKVTGEEINRFETIKQAAQIVGGDLASIVNVCKGKRKTSCGYAWKYGD